MKIEFKRVKVSWCFSIRFEANHLPRVFDRNGLSYFPKDSEIEKNISLEH